MLWRVVLHWPQEAFKFIWTTAQWLCAGLLPPWVFQALQLLRHWVSLSGSLIVLWALRLGLSTLTVIVYIHAVRRTHQVKQLADLAARQADLILAIAQKLEAMQHQVLELEAVAVTEQTVELPPSATDRDKDPGGPDLDGRQVVGPLPSDGSS